MTSHIADKLAAEAATCGSVSVQGSKTVSKKETDGLTPVKQKKGGHCQFHPKTH